VYLFQIVNLAISKKQIEVKDWQLESCGTEHNELQLQNIHVFNNQKDEILITGKVNVKTFLSAPVTVRLGESASEARHTYYVSSDLLCWVPKSTKKSQKYLLMSTVDGLYRLASGSSD
jgi:hypothetical protein